MGPESINTELATCPSYQLQLPRATVSRYDYSYSPLSCQVFKEEKYLKEAAECTEVIWQRGLLRKGYGICHGTAGNGYAFLSLYKLTQDKKYLYRTFKVGKVF